jgi:hypothetical protein
VLVLRSVGRNDDLPRDGPAQVGDQIGRKLDQCAGGREFARFEL